MRICFFAPANNYHTKKWVKWFFGRGHEIHVVSFIKDEIPGAIMHFINTETSVEDSDYSKLKYLLHARDFKKIVEKITPDIISVHYATSYGAVAALSGIKPYVLSVWGSDIYEFPNRSPLHKALLKYSLKKATYLFSTSQAMASEALKYTNRFFEITPFGVDMDLFNPKNRSENNNRNYIVGTIKKLESKYGINYLIMAISIIKKKYPKMGIELKIAGNGECEAEYKQLAKALGINDITKWLGFIPQEKAAKEWAGMDVAVVYSNQESFGVSAVEAQACGTALIISDVQGLIDVTNPNVSCLVVEKKNPEKLAKAIMTLLHDDDARKKMGEEGRNNVKEKYEMDNCFKHIESLFLQIKEQTNSIIQFNK